MASWSARSPHSSPNLAAFSSGVTVVMLSRPCVCAHCCFTLVPSVVFLLTVVECYTITPSQSHRRVCLIVSYLLAHVLLVRVVLVVTHMTPMTAASMR